jgi:tripartite-type tricarboxylate transporter receptor subunit TctC
MDQRRFRLLVSTGAAAWMMAHSALHAQTVEQFYNGKTISIVIGGASGGYDIIGRMVGKYFGKYIPGNPHVIVRNMPGAGGITATNYMYAAAEKDGLVIAVVGREALFDPVFSGADSKALYDSRKFVYLGTPNREVGMAYAMTASKVNSIEDVQKREVTAAASGATSGSATSARLVNALLGTKFKIILGYPGGSEAMLAMENGEVDARVVTGFAGPEAIKVNDWITHGKAKLLLQLAVKSHPKYQDIPLIVDRARSEDDRKVMELMFLGQELGRPFFAPPGLPADRAKALQVAFAKTMDDPEFQKDAKDYELSPLLAADLQAVVEKVYGFPKEILQKAIDVIAYTAK